MSTGIQNVLDFPLALSKRTLCSVRTTHVMTLHQASPPSGSVQILTMHGLLLLVTRIFRSVA
jgi:hypothetical protein